MKTIAVYSIKSNRRNTKNAGMRVDIYPEIDGEPKNKFAIDDIKALITFAVTCPYRSFKVVVIDDYGCLVSYNMAPIRYSIEQVINDIYRYARLLNLAEFNITLAELHNDAHIKRLIAKYYTKS